MEKKTSIIKKVEHQIEAEVKKDENRIKKLIKNPKFRIGVVIFVFVALIALVIYWSITQSRVYVERSQITAPIISLSSPAPGILEQVYVQEGDKVSKGMVVAQVGDYFIKSDTNGIVVGIKDTPGQIAGGPQDSIVEVVDPQQMRVIGRVDETKGLEFIQPGQKVIFTVDAYGSKQYEGIVDSITPTSHQSDIVFSISDKRAQQDFDVKVRFDVNHYPELLNGMSARMWIYK